MELGKNFAENVRRVDDCLRVRENFDLIKKELTVGGRETVFYYPDGMVDADVMEKLMIYLLSLKPDIWSGCAGDAPGLYRRLLQERTCRLSKPMSRAIPRGCCGRFCPARC